MLGVDDTSRRLLSDTRPERPELNGDVLTVTSRKRCLLASNPQMAVIGLPSPVPKGARSTRTLQCDFQHRFLCLSPGIA